MKTTLLAGLAFSLFSTAAFAQQYRYATPVPPGGTAYGVTTPNRYDRDCDGDDDRRDRRDRRGHYEMRTVSQWVPGATTQVFVAGFCHRPPFSPIQVCAPGHYETRTSPGYYQNTQQWVWVPHPGGGRWGRHHNGR